MSGAADGPDPAGDLLSDRLASGVLVFDGAMGTELLARSRGASGPPTRYSLTDPEVVTGLHRDYIAARADVISTNTFGADRVTLAEHGATVSVEQLNRAAVSLARREIDASGRSVLLAGTIAPAAAPGTTAGGVAATRDALVEQAECLAAAGVDLIVFETFSAIDQLAPVLERLTLDIPVVASFTYSADGSTFAGEDLVQVVSVMAALGVAALGANCLLGPTDLRPIVRALGRASALPVLMQPVGIPRSDAATAEGRRAAALAWAKNAWALASRGAAMVGGCCGTTPAHIAALAGLRARAEP